MRPEQQKLHCPARWVVERERCWFAVVGALGWFGFIVYVPERDKRFLLPPLPRLFGTANPSDSRRSGTIWCAPFQMSIPTRCRLFRSATIGVVAQPQNGSSTMSPSLLLARMMRSYKANGRLESKPTPFKRLLFVIVPGS